MGRVSVSLTCDKMRGGRRRNASALEETGGWITHIAARHGAPARNRSHQSCRVLLTPHPCQSDCSLPHSLLDLPHHNGPRHQPPTPHRTHPTSATSRPVDDDQQLHPLGRRSPRGIWSRLRPLLLPLAVLFLSATTYTMKCTAEYLLRAHTQSPATKSPFPCASVRPVTF
jgi:hypothetical protein